jgi:hypothetical protein
MLSVAATLGAEHFKSFIFSTSANCLDTGRYAVPFLEKNIGESIKIVPALTCLALETGGAMAVFFFTSKCARACTCNLKNFFIQLPLIIYGF